MSVYNPRHPHTCVIFRVVGEDEFSGGTKVVLYEGACRKFNTRNARTSERALMSQYTLSIPAIVQARAGDRVEVTDYVGKFEGGITEVGAGNWGTNIYFNDSKR
jgi:hypothetical protein